MKKYKTSSVFDYIMGNDIENVSELENDPLFMWKVINHTNDKKMYYFCEDSVKKDFNFVKNVIIKFKDDIDFVTKVFDYYVKDLKSKRYDLDAIELTMLISQIMGYKDKIKYLEYDLNNILFINHIEDDAKKSKYFLKEYEFALYEEMFGDRKIILDYVAGHILKQIYYKNEINFENYIHSLKINKEYIENMRPINFIIQNTMKYDEDLAIYLQMNPKLLDEFVKELNIVLKNWDKYEKRMFIKKTEVFDYYFYRYIEENETNCSLYIYDLKDIIIEKYNLYDFYNLSENRLNVEKQTIGDERAYRYACNLAEEIFIKEKYYKKDFDDYDCEKNKNAKIIKFKKQTN